VTLLYAPEINCIALVGALRDGEPGFAVLRLAAIGGTLLLFMGLGRVGRVVEGLRAGGLAPETPAAAISRGTLPDQEVVRTTLEGLASAAAGLAGPTLLVVGDVAALEVVPAIPELDALPDAAEMLVTHH